MTTRTKDCSRCRRHSWHSKRKNSTPRRRYLTPKSSGLTSPARSPKTARNLFMSWNKRGSLSSSSTTTNNPPSYSNRSNKESSGTTCSSRIMPGNSLQKVPICPSSASQLIYNNNPHSSARLQASRYKMSPLHFSTMTMPNRHSSNRTHSFNSRYKSSRQSNSSSCSYSRLSNTSSSNTAYCL
jgi:hypothetical protein